MATMIMRSVLRRASSSSSIAGSSSRRSFPFPSSRTLKPLLPPPPCLLHRYNSYSVRRFGLDNGEERNHLFNLKDRWLRLTSVISSGVKFEWLFPAALVAAGLAVIANGSPTPSVKMDKGDLEETARKVRRDLEELLERENMKDGSYPSFSVAVESEQISVKFAVPQSSVLHLLACLNLETGLDLMHALKFTKSGSSIIVGLRLGNCSPKNQKEACWDMNNAQDTNATKEDKCVLIHSSVSSCTADVEFRKSGTFSIQQLHLIVLSLKFAKSWSEFKQTLESDRSTENKKKLSVGNPVEDLKSLGVKVYGLDEPVLGNTKKEISWGAIAGYDQQKRLIEDTILMALHSPKVYDDIARGTRHKFESNRPRAVLFEGPPGTGKTSSARVIARQAGVPLLEVPLEIITSERYGQSERVLSLVFTLANYLPNGAIIFFDEVDSFATSRDGKMHEATRKILSVLLRQIDGFEQEKRMVVIAATNRKQDLDPALLSRFSATIFFGLPDHCDRQEIAAKYAKHLTKSELAQFASATEKMSGRDIKDVCLQAERHWASKIIRGQVVKEPEAACSLPPLQEYINSASDRKKAFQFFGGREESSDWFRLTPIRMSDMS